MLTIALATVVQGLVVIALVVTGSRERKALTKELVRAYNPAAAAAMDPAPPPSTPRQPAPRPDVDFLGL